ncbi:unnamed protein product [Paramecium sonneborni]|uniref:Uncharacterized protein n=1 Tax=Paramecium sonneborni TaxID=65129 RepID=A0A8S1LFG2_9CILI|nr:unnamed protein product [Paramecium sonneborni]
MLILILFTICQSVIVTLDKTCLCTEIFVESDCIAFGCQFQQKLCTNLGCTEVKSRVECDSRFDCSFDHKSQTCSAFSQCNAYYVDVEEQCYNKGNQVIGCVSSGKKTEGYYQCTNYLAKQKEYVICSDQLTSAACNGVQVDGYECVWKSISNQCIAFQLKNCDDASDLSESLCDISSCIWLNNECEEKQCKDFTSQSSCQYIPHLDGNSFTICSWSTNSCVELNSVSYLSQNNCTNVTLGTHFWNNVKNKCIECEGFAQLFLLNLILFITSF